MTGTPSKEVFIYTLSHPETNEVRYVGKTIKSLNARLRRHISDSEREDNYRTKWIRSLIKRGLKPKIEILECCLEENWQECEKYWIMMLRFLGVRLINATDGGDGMSGHLHNEETKAKISRSRIGMVFSEETKRKLSLSHIGKRHTIEAKKKIGISSKARGFSEKCMQRARIARTGQKVSEKTKEILRDKASRNREKYGRKISQFSLEGYFINTFNSQREASRETGIYYQGIGQCLKGSYKHSGGFIWKYLNK